MIDICVHFIKPEVGLSSLNGIGFFRIDLEYDFAVGDSLRRYLALTPIKLYHGLHLILCEIVYRNTLKHVGLLAHHLNVM